VRVEVDQAGFSRVLDELRACPSIELSLDMRTMRFDGAKAHAAKARDFDVGVAQRDQPQHLLLLR
jgi:hypothetical protein